MRANHDAPNKTRLLLAFCDLLALLQPDLLVNVLGRRYKDGLGRMFVYDVFAIEGLFATFAANGAISKDGQNPEHPQQNTDTAA